MTFLEESLQFIKVVIALFMLSALVDILYVLQDILSILESFDIS